jgi:hypothetical protein
MPALLEMLMHWLKVICKVVALDTIPATGFGPERGPPGEKAFPVVCAQTFPPIF